MSEPWITLTGYGAIALVLAAYCVHAAIQIRRSSRAALRRVGDAGVARGRRDSIREFRYFLRRHLAEQGDPCAERGIEWPCDVADAFAVIEADYLDLVEPVTENGS